MTTADIRSSDRERAPRARVAMYHGVIASPLAVPDWCFLDAERFAAQVKHLSEHYDVVRLMDLPRLVRSSNATRPAVAITFDDGFMNNWEVAWPILERSRIPVTIFVVTGLIGTSDTTWSCRLHDAIERTGHTTLEWDGIHFDLTGAAGKAHASRTLQAALKRLAGGYVDDALGSIVSALGGSPKSPIPRSSPYRMLDWQAVREMVATGLVDLGAHTRSHSILSLLSRDHQEREIHQSIKDVEDAIGRPCRSFAYPNGRSTDFDGASLEILRALGIEVSVTTEEGDNDAATDPLRLRRYGIGNDWDFGHFLEGL